MTDKRIMELAKECQDNFCKTSETDMHVSVKYIIIKALSERDKEIEQMLPSEEEIVEQFPSAYFTGVVQLDIPNSNDKRKGAQWAINTIKSKLKTKSQ